MQWLRRGEVVEMGLAVRRQPLSTNTTTSRLKPAANQKLARPSALHETAYRGVTAAISIQIPDPTRPKSVTETHSRFWLPSANCLLSCLRDLVPHKFTTPSRIRYMSQAPISSCESSRPLTSTKVDPRSLTPHCEPRDPPVYRGACAALHISPGAVRRL